MKTIDLNFDDQVNNMVPYKKEETTGFIENFVEQARLQFREELSISSQIPSDMAYDRRKQLIDLNTSGVISDEVVSSYYDYDKATLDDEGLSVYARDVLGREDVLTLREYKKAEDKEYTQKREAAGEMADKAGVAGTIGVVLGAVGPHAIDPIILPSYLLGYGEVATALRAAKYLAAAKKMGPILAVEGALEGVRQIPVASFKQDLGVDYSTSDAAKNVALTLGAVTALGVGVPLLAKTVSRSAKEAANAVEESWLPKGDIRKLIADLDFQAKEANKMGGNYEDGVAGITKQTDNLVNPEIRKDPMGDTIDSGSDVGTETLDAELKTEVSKLPETSTERVAYEVDEAKKVSIQESKARMRANCPEGG